MDARYDGLEDLVPLQGLVGYLNFSQGKPDPRFQKQLAVAYDFLARRGAEQPWQALADVLRAKLQALHAAGTAGFQDVAQAEAVLRLAVEGFLPAYRRHHSDLLFHAGDQDLFQPFFLTRVFESVLAQGPPWEESARIVQGALGQLNDFVGHRPIAILETRPRAEPYDHERVRPVPWYVRGAGVAPGRYRDLIAQALELLQAADPDILQDAGFDPALLDELAVDPRAYDHGHPVNRRPNYVFGEWDPHHLDNQGRYRRYVARQVTLDAILDRVARPGGLDRGELLFEGAAVLAGTLLMATGVSGNGPGAHDSSASLAALMPRIARYRDRFYQDLLARLKGPHGDRLRREAEQTRQPFGGARQHLNQYLANCRAAQLQQRHLALLFAEMGYPEAGRKAAARIPAPSVRLLSEMVGLLSTGHVLLERPGHESGPGALREAAPLLPQVENLLRRGIACGAFADPWNILGFQGLFPLSGAREDSVRDPRVDDLVQVMVSAFSLYARLLSEAAAAGESGLVKSLSADLRKLAGWWDRFASAEVSEVRRVHGGEAADSAEQVARALAQWQQRGEAAADLAFWKQHLANFRSPKAFALVVEALLRKEDYRASLALLVNWLNQAEQVPLDDGEHSFHNLALAWMLRVAGTAGGWALVTRFFDYLEANAEDYWEVPALETGGKVSTDEPAGGLFSAAYEDVVYKDSADDDNEGAVADGGLADSFDLEAEAERLEKRLSFLGTVARLWLVAARRAADDPDRRAALVAWRQRARDNEGRLLSLLDAVYACPVPAPLGSFDSLVEFDRRRGVKEQLTHATINACLETALAAAGLQGALGPPDAGPGGNGPAWQPSLLRLGQALLRGDAGRARDLLPAFLEQFRGEPLVLPSLANGGEPRRLLRARLAQTVLRALAAGLPRLGLLRETHRLLRTALDMERGHGAGPRGVSEFDYLFQAGYQGAAECVTASAAGWEPSRASDRQLVEALERLTTPFLNLWVEHSHSLQLSALEPLAAEPEWQALRGFVQRYGRDLFHARFMTLGNLRGILHRGSAAYLDYLRDNPDPLHPVRLLDDLDAGRVSRADAERHLQRVLQAVVENYEGYKDYKSTVAQSDYGENLHVLLDLLRVKALYERHAWQFRPLVWAHEVLARQGRVEAAQLWQESFRRVAQDFADALLDNLARREQALGVKLRTISDRLQERFVRPLDVDRLCALVGPAVEESGRPGDRPAFAQLEARLRHQAESPTGVGLDVPQWLRRLEQEVRRVRAAQSGLTALAEDAFRVPSRPLTFEELEDHLQGLEPERTPE